MTPAFPRMRAPRTEWPGSITAASAKVANCQIGVSGHGVTDAASCRPNWRLLVPERWDAGVATPKAAGAIRARRPRAGIPDTAGHHPHGRALEMLDKRADWGLPRRWWPAPASVTFRMVQPRPPADQQCCPTSPHGPDSPGSPASRPTACHRQRRDGPGQPGRSAWWSAAATGCRTVPPFAANPRPDHRRQVAERNLPTTPCGHLQTRKDWRAATVANIEVPYEDQAGPARCGHIRRALDQYA
jgi:hypothetical protein